MQKTVLFVGYLIAVNLLGIALMGIDKQKARKRKWRIPERTLFLCALLGGSAGAWAGMYLFRHQDQTLVFCRRNAAYFGSADRGGSLALQRRRGFYICLKYDIITVSCA